jgi:aminomethyltransferase
MTGSLARTALHAWHVDHGGKMVDFAGWSMPVQYSSIIEEHHATRQRAALFDVSHMGRLRLEGRGAASFLDGLLTRQVTDLAEGRIRYSLVTHEGGGILDDVLVYHLRGANAVSFLWLVVNASNREKIVAWLQSHRESGSNCSLADWTMTTAMIAVQGPQALAIAQQVLPWVNLSSMKYYTGHWLDWDGRPLLVSRTGYTGEDGVELTVSSERAVDLWQDLLTAGNARGARPAGLGARDTLRLEAALPLYGHELSEQINPVQAGLKFAVYLGQRSFPGCEAIGRALHDPGLPQRIGLRLSGKRVARERQAVLDAKGDAVGEVTSGTFSPTLQCPIAMAYVRPEFSRTGQDLWIDLRGRPEAATVVALPFYQRG